jgi:hypothetical protein
LTQRLIDYEENRSDSSNQRKKWIKTC